MNPAVSQQRGDVQILSDAFGAMRAGNWPEATRRARAGSEVVEDLVEWHRLRAGNGEMSDYLAFIADNPEWPGMPLLRKRGEESIPRSVRSQSVLTYFADAAPQTGVGSLRLAAAYAAQGQQQKADAEIVRSWRELDLTRDEREAFQQRHGALIAPHTTARLDTLIWRGKHDQAEALYPLVNASWVASSKARIGLRRQVGGVDRLIDAVPADFAKGSALAYERFNWRARKGRADAIDLLLERSTSVSQLGRPSYWGGRRRSLARAEMRKGNARLAYRIASTHFLTEGSTYADLEWLSGYLSLRYLNNPEQALSHFERFQRAVVTPISLGRAGYWRGRAYEAMGRKDAAQEAYGFGATYQSSFYGQLAAEKAGFPMDAALIGGEKFPDWTQSRLRRSEVVQAGLVLQEAGELNLATRFMVHQGETLNRTELGQLGDLAISLNESYMALMVAKEAASQGYVIDKAYYPLHDLRERSVPVQKELALSIARRESEFNPRVVSPVGARGLMQLMPATAQQVAGEIGVSYSKSKLLSDWRYNAQLGSAYLANLKNEFGNNPILISVGYNAGPSRARRWMKDRGDPRSSSVDVVDWIEHIPFRETRNYVMRVSEALAVYRVRLSGKVERPHLAEELQGR
ncbi:MAG: lytic transglycosylase domain-containing protein [Pseudoruegeria sp.]